MSAVRDNGSTDVAQTELPKAARREEQMVSGIAFASTSALYVRTVGTSRSVRI